MLWKHVEPAEELYNHPMHALATKLYTPNSVKRLDQSAIQSHGISGHTLMRRAGRAVLDVLLERYPQAK